MTPQTQQHTTWLAAHDADVTAEELWLHYYSIGGNLTAFELDAYLHGAYRLPVAERNAIAWALNELIDDLPQSFGLHRFRAEMANDPRRL